MSYISSSFPRFVEHMEPHEVVFQMAKSGKTRQLKQYLNRKNKEERKKIVATKYNGATCLIMACRNGHYEIVEYLVESAGACLELTGLVNFEGENIEGAPPLWCASAAGHLKIVKYLVSKGADVNSTTKSNSTALRAACFDGHLEIVKYLVENNADIEIANRHGHTCLMIACYKGHLSIAKYLINKGADLNRKSVKGNTALHDCAECGSLEIMKLLLSHNAKMAPDSYQMTPILAAAVTGHSAIVDFLLGRSECEPMEKISALELLGATYVDKKHDMLSAYNYWKAALERRSAMVLDTDGKPVLLSKEATVTHRPLEAYDFATEFMTLRELDECLVDPDEVRMQALLIRERILGPTHPDTTYYIRYRGAVYADCGNFRKCILLWLYALDTQQKSLESYHPMIQSSFLSFTELFQYMQKQLLPTSVNGAGAGAGAGAGNHLATVDDLDTSGSQETARESLSPNTLTMYTSTVHKILQQTVHEIKRGQEKIKQCLQTVSLSASGSNSADSNNTEAKSNTPTRANTINQIQKQVIESSPGYNRVVNGSSPTTPETTNSASEAIRPSTSTSSTTTVADSTTLDSQTPAANAAAILAASVEIANFDRTLVVIVHFLIVVAESLKYCSPEETFRLKKLVYELVKLNPISSKKSTLLHLAASRESSALIKNHTLSSFPSTEALRLLLECGADPNALDAERNSPLHLAASNRHFPHIISQQQQAPVAAAGPNVAIAQQQPAEQALGSPQALAQPESPEIDNNAGANNSPGASPSTSTTFGINSERDKIILLLLNANAHLDACNMHNKTPADMYKGGKMYQVINPINYLSLQCLAAKVIRRHEIPYKEHLTSKLTDFVSMH